MHARLGRIHGAAHGSEVFEGSLDVVDVLDHVSHQTGLCHKLWKFYGKKHGWQLKCIKRKKAVLYMVPKDGFFSAGLALNAKAFAALDDSELPPEVVAEIKGGPGASEGQPARFELTDGAHVENIKTLVGVMLASI